MEDIIVDRVEVVEIRGRWYVKGYLDDIEVVTVGGWVTQDEHVNAVLYDTDGVEVPHKIIEPIDTVAFIRGMIAAYSE